VGLVSYRVPDLIGLARRRRDGAERRPEANPLIITENCVGTKKTGKGRRKIGRKKRRMRAKIRHRKG
jgi:hypothetical protein